VIQHIGEVVLEHWAVGVDRARQHLPAERSGLEGHEVPGCLQVQADVAQIPRAQAHRARRIVQAYVSHLQAEL